MSILAKFASTKTRLVDGFEVQQINLQKSLNVESTVVFFTVPSDVLLFQVSELNFAKQRKYNFVVEPDCYMSSHKSDSIGKCTIQ